MKKRRRRIMIIRYWNESHVNCLKKRLDALGIPYVIFEIDRFSVGPLWEICIDRGTYTWEKIMSEVNQVKPEKFRFVSNQYIKDGNVYVIC